MPSSTATNLQWETLSQYGKNFDAFVSEKTTHALGITPSALEIFQVNIGRWCNQACHHCHVNASPKRTEFMNWETMEACLKVISSVSTIHTVDITGGAPEGNPEFRRFVIECKKLGKHVIDRCNLTILEEKDFSYLYEFLYENQVELCCSLPHFRKSFTDKQRGDGVFEKSIKALQNLVNLGYGKDPRLKLNLVYNPIGLFISSSQRQLEREFKVELQKQYGIVFNNLYCINNMPIHRFLDSLLRQNKFQSYMDTLANAFNPMTVSGLMCRNQISVGYEGSIYDCDFNQMLDKTVTSDSHISEFRLDSFLNRKIVTNSHCFGCTAGSGSSCGGEIA